MHRIICFTAFICFCCHAIAQETDSMPPARVVVIKDSRLDELARREAAFNEAFALAPKAGKGYRLVVLSTNDRQLAQSVRAKLLQRYPEQKAYTVFQAPNIKLKFGNYVEKAEAEQMRKDILKNGIVTGNIYIVPETIEVRADKNKEKETE